MISRGLDKVTSTKKQQNASVASDTCGGTKRRHFIALLVATPSTENSQRVGIWNDIKVAFENDNFPAIKNTLCDWCYYKPICPVFNKNSPDTDDLKTLTLEIKELEDLISALSMFNNTADVPESSDLYGINKEEVESKKISLEKKRNTLVLEIDKLLRK